MTNTSLSQNVPAFCSLLRSRGFTVGTEDAMTVLELMTEPRFLGKNKLQLALKALLCRNKEELEAFDELFNYFWERKHPIHDAKSRTRQKDTARQKATAPSVLSAWLQGRQAAAETEETASFSRMEALSRKDFAGISADESEELIRMLRNLSRQLARRLKRRYEKTHRRSSLDIRRTLRMNMRKGGELLDLFHRRPAPNRLKLLLLCDVSRSMELYSRFFLLFMFAISQVYAKMEIFVFSTMLQRISPLLSNRSFNQAMLALQPQTGGWGGGTRIGESLETFVQNYGKLVDGQTIVLIVSDGWDTGGTETIPVNMQWLHRKAKKIIWLNPLAGFAGFSPETAALKAANPFIDAMVPVYNVQSLRALRHHL